MRALISWDIDRGDPELQQIMLAMGDCFPQGSLRALTNQTAVADRVTVRVFSDIDRQLQGVAARFRGRFFYVFSLHSDADPVWGVFRTGGGGGR